MRIVIEIEPSELRPSLKVEGAEGKILSQKATDAGGPPDFLVEVLSDESESESTGARDVFLPEDADAGSGPAWNVEGMDMIFSQMTVEGNGHSNGGPALR